MEPLTALAVASAVIQIVDFSSKVIARTREIYLSADGTIQETTLLEDATANLEELMIGLRMSTPFRVGGNALIEGNVAVHQNTPDYQLLQLAEESRNVVITLRGVLNSVEVKKDGTQRSPLDQGFRSVLEQKKIATLKQRLDDIRKQIDTTLLVSLR